MSWPVRCTVPRSNSSISSRRVSAAVALVYASGALPESPKPGVSKQAAAKTIGFPEERGYIVGEADQRDHRRRRFAVTPEGHALRATGEQVFDELRDRWAQRIGVKELERLEDALADLGIRAPSRLNAAGLARWPSSGISLNKRRPLPNRTPAQRTRDPTWHAHDEAPDQGPMLLRPSGVHLADGQLAVGYSARPLSRSSCCADLVF